MDAKQLAEIRERHEAVDGPPRTWHTGMTERFFEAHEDRGYLLAALDEARAQLLLVSRGLQRLGGDTPPLPGTQALQAFELSRRIVKEADEHV